MKLGKPKLSRYMEDKKINEAEEFIDMNFFNETLNASMHNTEWNSCTFKNIDFSNVELKGIDIIDCVFDSCDLSNLEIGNTFLRCIFNNCKLIGLNVDQCSCKNVSFKNCILDFSLFSESFLEKILIDDSSMKETRMYNITHKDLEFSDSNLSDLEVINTKMKNIDLSSCNIERMRIATSDLEGVILDVTQLVDLAPQFGVVIKG